MVVKKQSKAKNTKAKVGEIVESKSTEIATIKPQEIAPQQECKLEENTPKQLSAMLEEETERQKLIEKFVNDNLVENNDYGKIGNFPKPVLLKPGSEKVCSLFKITARFKKDQDTFEMLGSPTGTIALICELVQRSTGLVLGEGKGVATVAEKQNNPNTAVKIAEKRAQVDAVLRTFALSGRFTQDEEVLREAQQQQAKPWQKPATPPPAPKETPAQMYLRAVKMIGSSNNADGLIEWSLKIGQSKVFDKKQITELQKLCSSKVDIINNIH